jgi:hypothetical protein
MPFFELITNKMECHAADFWISLLKETAPQKKDITLLRK